MNEHIERFNAAAQNYQTDRYPGCGQCMQKVLELLTPLQEDIILDIGCGPGTQLVKLSEFIKFGYGLDPAEEMIDKAKTNSKDINNLTFYTGTAESPPVELYNKKINKVFSNYALHHLSNDEKFLSIKNISEILPQNGIFVLGDLMFSEDPMKHEDLFDVIGYGPGSDTPAYLYEIENFFNKADFEIEKHVLTPLTAVIVGKKLKV